MIPKMSTEDNQQNLLDEILNITIVPSSNFVPIYVPAHEAPALVYLASLANGSHETMLGALNTVADLLTTGLCDHLTMPWPQVRYIHTNAVRAWLMQNYAPSTGNKMLSAVRGTLKTCWEMGLMSVEDYMRACNVKNIKGRRIEAAAGRMFTDGEINAILAACAADGSAAGVRDASMIGLGVFCGLRRAEIAELECEHYDSSTGMVFVYGKGGSVRNVPVTTGVRAALADWLIERDEGCPVMFQRINKGGRIIAHGMSVQAVNNMVKKRVKQAGIRAATTHDMRRTFVSKLLAAGADISTVQRLAGHANTSTTAGYDRRGEDAKRDAVGLLHMAWERRHA